MEKVLDFLRESRSEFYKVNWPTLDQTTRLTLVVILMSLLTAVFLGGFDALMFYGWDKILVR